MIDWTKNKYGELNSKYPIHTKIVRYLISGGTAAFTNIAFLYIFTDIFGIWYIISGGMSFVIAFVISFILQKFWTFQDTSKDGLHRQVAVYFVTAIINLILNTGMLYIQVEYLGVHYLISQIIAGMIIALESYFVYQILIFKKVEARAEVVQIQ